jgi:hypothetical protein
MTTPITINVFNKSNSLQNFFFFQQPSKYSGGAEVFSNSIYTAALLPYEQYGGSLTFQMILEFYAGVQQQVAPPKVGVPSGTLGAKQPINLTPKTGAPIKNGTNMTVAGSLGLAPPVSMNGVQPGAFRIVVPSYNSTLVNYNAGSSVATISGAVTLSNFVTAMPSTNLDCQPVIIFYVQTGSYTPGTVMNFTASSVNAAVCDFTPGYSVYNVTYDVSGQWTTEPFSQVMMADGRRKLVSGSGETAGMMGVDQANAEVRNEAGSAVVSYGNAANFNAPVIVTNLNNPGGLVIGREYQLGPIGQPSVGLMCIEIDGTTATFA